MENEIINQASVETQDQKGLLQHIGASSDAIQKIQSISQTIDGAVKVALQRTNSQDWVKMGDKFYLQATGIQKIRSVFGIYFKDQVITKEVFDEGGYAYICSGVAGSTLLNQLYGATEIQIEGARSSSDPFFTKGDRTPDPMDLRKASQANFQVRAVTALLGLANYNAEDLKRMGVNTGAVSSVNYSKGSEGGGNTAVISEAQRKRLFAISSSVQVAEPLLKAHLIETYKIDSTTKILRSDYEKIVAWVQSQGIKDFDTNTGEPK